MRGSESHQEKNNLLDDNTDIIALYASQSHEPTIEMSMPPGEESGRVHGLLTYTINQVLHQTKGALTYRELAQRIHHKYIQWGRISPTPLLEGSGIDREILGKTFWKQRSRLRVSRTQQGKWKVNAGSIHGVTSGSIYSVLPPQNSKDNNSKVNSYVKVTQTAPLHSFVEPCAYQNSLLIKKLPTTASCQLVAKSYGESSLTLAISNYDQKNQPFESSFKKKLLELLKKLTQEEGAIIKLAESDQKADWLLVPSVESNQSREVYLAQTHGDSNLQKGKNRSFGPAKLDSHFSEWLRIRSRRIIKVRNLLALASNDEESLFGDDFGLPVELKLLRCHSASQKKAEVVQWSSGREVQVGDVIEFHIHNTSRVPIDATLLFVDEHFGIVPFFPRTGQFGQNRIEPGKTAVSRKAKVSLSHRPEHMILIAVRAKKQSEPLDFTFLAQPTLQQAQGKRGSTRGLSSSLGKLLSSRLLRTSNSRGNFSAEGMDEHAIRLISWHVTPQARKIRKD